MTGLKTALVLTMVVGLASAVTLVLINHWWAFLPVCLAVGSVSLSLYCWRTVDESYGRLLLLRNVLVAAARTGRASVEIGALQKVLRFGEVDEVLKEVRRAEDELWQRRHARGEQSDF